MKNSITLLCFYILSNFTFSQATITGKIVDSNNNPLDAAAISLLSDSNQFIKAAVSTSKGFFKIANVKNGNYYLKIESLGFKLYKSDKIIVTNDKNLNTKPLCVIANTIKGKGVSFMENNTLWHYRSPQEEEYRLAMKELEKKDAK